MTDILEFFGGIFDTSGWPPRWYCGVWTDFHGWLYIISDFGIFLAYALIPTFIFKFIREKEGIPVSNVFLWFVAFIVLCGFTHLIDAIMFWYPIYRFSALIRFFTMVVSMVTVYKIVQIYPQLMALKTSNEFQAEIEQRKDAEYKMREYAGQLESSVADLEQFAYVASHDLQEPLNTIKSYISMLDENLKGKLGDEEKEFMKYTLESSNRMQVLLQELLSYSRLGKNEDKEWVDLNKAVEEVLNDLKSKVKESGADIYLDTLPELYTSKIEIHLLFQNLLTNALKFKSSQRPLKVSIRSHEREEDYLISVEDNGIGIDPKYQGKIFQIFQRLHNRSDYPGTGVGLSTCKKIVEGNGGKIWFENKDQGVRFIIVWPKNRL